MNQTMNKIKTILSYIIFSLCILFIPNTVEAATVKSGSIPCSSGSVSWELSDTGKLKFLGSGTTQHNFKDYWKSVDSSILEQTKSIDLGSCEIKFVGTSPSYLFADFTNAATILSIENLDMSQATSVSYMFYNCKSVTDLNIQWGDVAITDFSNMFANCSSLKTLYLGWENTSPTSFVKMFYNCSICISILHIYLI